MISSFEIVLFVVIGLAVGACGSSVKLTEALPTVLDEMLNDPDLTSRSVP